MTQNTQTTKIPIDVLQGIGFMPGDKDALVPKQKDMFSNFTSFTDGLGGTNLNEELKKKEEEENKQKEETQSTETEQKADPAKPVDIGTLAAAISETVKTSTKEEESIANGDSVPADKEEITGKRALVKYLTGKIESGEFQAYEDYDETKQKLSEYLNGMPTGELEGLLDKNRELRENSIKDEYPKEFFQSLPGHLKYVAEALAKGTIPAEDIYAALLRTEQSRNLNPNEEDDQSLIVRNYLSATNFGTQEEISTQIEEWKEANTLGKKAIQFKPKLDTMQEQQVIAYARQADEVKQQQEEAAKWYAHSVETALSDGELGGIKINRKQQKQLYDSLLVDIRPSQRDGRPMNGLWRTLENIQMVEPDFKRLAEITWLATDPEGYRETLIQQGRNEQQTKITKELKTQQGVGANQGAGLTETQKRKQGIIKQKVNPFDR